MAATVRRKKRYGILTIDPWLERYEGDIDLRMGRYKSVKRSLLPAGTKLQDFATAICITAFTVRTRDGSTANGRPAPPPCTSSATSTSGTVNPTR